jgi:hypothetical protein
MDRAVTFMEIKLAKQLNRILSSVRKKTRKTPLTNSFSEEK